MPSLQTDNLFKLIKSMSKSEKRNFKLYVNRVQSKETARFIQLFDVLDKQKKYDEALLLQKIPTIKRTQLSNQKRHLYKQLLTSLRLIHTQKNPDLQIREQLDYGKILYNKGLYMQSLKLLDRVKQQAFEANLDLLHLEIIEFEKLIESRHITRSIENRAEALTTESEKRIEVIHNASKLSNLALKMYGLYIKLGHIRNQKNAYIVWEFFKSNLPNVDPEKLTFFEKIHLYQCYVWYNYILQNFLQCFKYSQKWVDLFKKDVEMQNKDRELFMRGYNNLLAALFYVGHHSKLVSSLKELEKFAEKNDDSFNVNEKTLIFLYVETAKINTVFLEGSFTKGLKIIPNIEKKLKEYSIHLDHHRIMVFYYKIASLYFGAGKNQEALIYLNKVIHFKEVGNLREDIQCYARLLHLIVHFELGHTDLLEYIIKSVYRFLAKMEDLNLVQSEILKFLRNALYLERKNLIQSFKKLKNKLEILVEHPYEKRSFLYLDIISWLESKIQNRTVEEIIHEKFKKSKKGKNRIMLDLE